MHVPTVRGIDAEGEDDKAERGVRHKGEGTSDVSPADGIEPGVEQKADTSKAGVDGNAGEDKHSGGHPPFYGSGCCGGLEG